MLSPAIIIYRQWSERQHRPRSLAQCPCIHATDDSTLPLLLLQRFLVKCKMMARSYQLHLRVTPPVPIRSRYVVCKPESTGVSLMYCTARYMCTVPVPRVASRMGRAAPNQKRGLLQVHSRRRLGLAISANVFPYSTVQNNTMCYLLDAVYCVTPVRLMFRFPNGAPKGNGRLNARILSCSWSDRIKEDVKLMISITILQFGNRLRNARQHIDRHKIVAWMPGRYAE